MYKVIRPFTDTETKKQYAKGDTYEPSTKKRAEELSTTKNKRGKVYIQKENEEAADKPDEPVEELSYKELKAQAKEAGIKGYHQMKKEDLKNALKG